MANAEKMKQLALEKQDERFKKLISFEAEHGFSNVFLGYEKDVFEEVLERLCKEDGFDIVEVHDKERMVKYYFIDFRKQKGNAEGQIIESNQEIYPAPQLVPEILPADIFEPSLASMLNDFFNLDLFKEDKSEEENMPTEAWGIE